MSLTEITFFECFESDILSAKKTITVRDESETDFAPNSVVQVSTYETGRWFCEIMIKDIQPITFDQLSEFHATQENMTLSELKTVIREIYPNINHFYVISYVLIK